VGILSLYKNEQLCSL